MTARPFTYAAAVSLRFPAARAAIVAATNVDNTAPPDGLAAEYAAVQSEVLARLADLPIAEHDSIRAWRRTFTELGVKPTQYRCAPEALLRRLQRHGDVPSISPLVDIGNLVSARHSLPVAVIDLGAVKGGITVRLARGDEPFDDLGGSEAEHPAEGEVVFVDDADAVTARRWCWRQSRPTAASEATTDVLVVVEAHHDDAAADVAVALADLERLVTEHAAPTERVTGTLDQERTSFGP